MKQRIAHIALIVKDYDEAIDFYTKNLDFILLEDTKLDEKKRWVMVAPRGAQECSLLLAKAVSIACSCLRELSASMSVLLLRISFAAFVASSSKDN